jgi:hypothetical protein
LKSTICKDEPLKKTKFMAFLHSSCWKRGYISNPSGLLDQEVHDLMPEVVGKNINIVHPDYLIRTVLYDELAAQYKSPTAMGNCRGTEGEDHKVHLPDKYKPGDWHMGFPDEVVGAWEEFKFAIVMQNTHTPGGVQEKITHAWLSSAVPVYFGPETALTQYNPDSFVNCHLEDIDETMKVLSQLHYDIFTEALQDHNLTVTFEPDENQGKAIAIMMDALLEGGVDFERTKNFEDMVTRARKILRADFASCIAQIKHLDQNEDAWMKMVTAPVVASGKIEGSDFDINMYAERFRAVLKNADSYLVK